jgi:hypothetical protein
MARYLKITGPGSPEWTTNPQQQNAARILAQFEVGSVESRAAARAMLVRCEDEPLIIRDSAGSLLVHERSFQPEMARELLDVIRRIERTPCNEFEKLTNS